MEFNDYAAKETSDLIKRVFATSSQETRQRVEALRAALDTAAKALQGAAADAPDTEAEVADLVGRLAKAATAEADARLKRLSTEARKITDSLRADLDEQAKQKETLEESLKDALLHLDGVRAELIDQQKAKDDLLGSLTEAREQTEAIRGELSSRTEDRDALAESLAEYRTQADAVRTELGGLTNERDALAESLSEYRAQADAVRTELGVRTEERDALADSLAEYRTRADAVQDQLNLQTNETGAVAEALNEARTQLDMIRAELKGEEKRAETLQQQLDAVFAEQQSVDAARSEAIVAHGQEAAARSTLEAQLQDVQALLETTLADASHARTELHAMTLEKGNAEQALGDAKSQAQAAEAKLAATTTMFKKSSARVKVLERELEEREDAQSELEDRLDASAGQDAPAGDHGVSAASLLDGLLGAFEALSSAATIGDVLSTLVEQLVNEFPRVALFRVKGNRLEGAHQIGFDLTNDIGKVMMPLAMDSLLTRAVSTGRTERVSGDRTDSSYLPFGGTPACALAMPIVVGGESIAVVYADDSGEARSEESASDDDLNARFAEALRHHAVALLTRLTSELKAMAELRAYAGSLVTEIEQMYQSDVAAAKMGDDLHKRLHGNLDYARSIYANRVASEPAATAGLLEMLVGGTIELNRDNAFGRDLAVVVAWDSAGNAARKAEAS
jgi:predicted  nucleic acid-binding Zn-ribbon protein